LLEKTHIVDGRPLESPTVLGAKLYAHDDELLSDPIEYRQVIGALQYYTLTRPDINYEINQLCQFIYNPKESYWGGVL